MNDLRYRAGLSVFSEIMGGEQAAAIDSFAQSGEFGASLAELAITFPFGSVWSREGLARRDRSLIVIAILIAQRQTAELRNHVRIGLRNGVEPREFEEMLIQAVPYVGFPAVAQAMEAVVAVLNEETDAGVRGASERGLL